MPTFGECFAGIGGFGVGLEAAGFTCEFQIEIDPHCQGVLRRHFPHARRYGDITAIDPATLPYVDVLAGGSPCQGLSVAGRRAGLADERSGFPDQVLDYPLLTLRISRNGCANIILREGLPLPPKSACWFCPYHTLQKWQEMRDREPELFERAATLEKLINDRREALGRDPVWLTRKLLPLHQATSDEATPSLFDLGDDNCESGYCMV